MPLLFLSAFITSAVSVDFSPFIIPLATLAAYIITYSLSWSKKIPLALHRKIWNGVLALSFATVGLTGIYLYAMNNAGLFLQLPFSANDIHQQAGIVLAIVAFFHAMWHISYFKSYLSG